MIVELKIRSLLLGVSLLTAAFASAQTTQTSEPVQTTAQTQGTTNPEIEALKLKISSNPDDTQSLVALATAYQNVNDWNSAIATWNKITAILPDWAPAYYSIGYANQSAKNNEAAKTAYEQYIAKVKPEEVDAAK